MATDHQAVEYCLFWVQSMCLPSSDWAAWVQGIGSIIGLIVAIAVPSYLAQFQEQTHRQEHRLKARAAAPRVIELLEIILGVMTPHAGFLAEGSNSVDDVHNYVFVSSIGPNALPSKWDEIRDQLPHFAERADMLFNLETHLVRSQNRIFELQRRQCGTFEEQTIVINELRLEWFATLNKLLDVLKQLEHFRATGTWPGNN